MATTATSAKKSNDSPPQSSTAIKTAHVVSFLTPLLATHFGTVDLASVRASTTGSQPPFFLGLNGIQGCGKTTLVRRLADTLRNAPYSLPTAVLSIDDLYLPHSQQKALAEKHADNQLVQHRGQPGTHDVDLGVHVFESLCEGRRTKLPSYDKSSFNGEGDRVPEDTWETVNDGKREDCIRVVIFEGWCVGFRPMEEAHVKAQWHDAVAAKQSGDYQGQLGHVRLADAEFINAKLRHYDRLTEYGWCLPDGSSR